MRTFSTLTCLCASLVVIACSKPFVAYTPSGFAALDDPEDKGYDYRAAHPDGLVLAVRVVKNEPEASLVFWTRAVENQLRLGKGYRLISQATVKNSQGIQGNLLKFGHDEGKTPHLYRVALYLKGKRLYVLELGGASDLVGAHEIECNQFVEGFVIK